MTEPADRIVELYRRHAARWDERRGRDLRLERAWLDRFTALLPPGGTVLDLGCGTGDPIARHLLGKGFAVTGLDASPELIALARARLPAAEWLVGDLRDPRALDSTDPTGTDLTGTDLTGTDLTGTDLTGTDLTGTALAGRSFDGLLAWHSTFHLRFDEQRALFPWMAAHARPGSALMFTSGGEHGEAIGDFEGDPLYHASLAPAEYRELLAGNGFRLQDVRLNDPDCGHAGVWLASFGAPS